MATKTFYGGITETNSLYGSSSADKATYFEWMIFKDALGQPTTPTGGAWNFDTNTGTAPTGWLNSPPSAVNYLLWVSIAIVDSRNPTVLTWSPAGLMASPSGGASGVAVSASGSLQNNGTVSFANSNGVSFGLSNGVMTASAAGGGGGVGIQGSGTIVQTSGTVQFANAGGVTFGLINGTMTASVATDYMASNQGSNFLSVSQSSLFQQVSNTSAITSNAMNVSVSGSFQQTSNTSNITSNAFPSSNTTKFAGTGTTFAGTNATATLALNSNGFAMSLSAASGGGGGGGGAAIQGSGTYSQSTGTVQFANSNNITFGLSNNGTMTASFSQSVDTGKVGIGYSSTTQAGSTVGATQNSNGLSMAWPPFLTTAQSAGAYLTTARASNDAVGLNTALTANGVSWTVNSSGLSLNVPAFLTTAAQSNHSHNFATTTTAGSNIVVGTANSAGATIGVPAYITTYAAQTNQTVASGNIAGVGTTFAGTNASGSMTLNSNGLNFALSVAAGGGGTTNQTGPNIAVAGSTVTSGDVYFSNSPTVTFGMAGSTITASAAGGGGGGVTLPGYELFPPLGGNTAFSTGGLGTIYIQKFIAAENVSFNNIERRFSGSTVSSAISAQAAHSISYGLYSLGSGASTSIYNLIASSSMFLQASYSSNLSAGYTVSAGGVSNTNSSAGTVGQGNLTGFKHIYFPFTSTITGGGQYAFAMNMSSATTGATGPLRIGFQELSVINNLTIGKIYNSTVVASNASYVGDYAQGVYSSSSNGLPATLALSGLTNAVSQQRMYLQFDA